MCNNVVINTQFSFKTETQCIYYAAILVVGDSLFPYLVKFAVVYVVKLIDLTCGFTLTPSLHSRQDLPLKSQVLQVHSCSKCT